MAIDESFKRPGAVPFKWEIRPGVPKAQPPPPPSQKSSAEPRQQLKPPPAGLCFFPPAELGSRSMRSLSRPRSDRWRFDQPHRAHSRSLSLECFPAPFPKRKGSKKSTDDQVEEAEFDYASNLETVSRWLSSTTTCRKPLSPFHDSPSSFSFVSVTSSSMSSRRSPSPFRGSPFSFYSGSARSSPRGAADAEWAGFGLF
ncbi:PREDICTED: uncharacterized protein LOC104605800 [Nelumbo nucifera]|uniref:Uncharacterized protein LOC104605800 n=2 Tax=Nelumbo nucifera TaxID=4432 RepID=A0A1U8AZN8_NELNU|nr:PREDICTED: uncharacterized protein LOC104605800 [Nelumbo nucifera]DAD24679.1 TPA_asm: hypothetical protein HUJ06_026143 [Nelumbo nucifera]